MFPTPGQGCSVTSSLASGRWPGREAQSRHSQPTAQPFSTLSEPWALYPPPLPVRCLLRHLPPPQPLSFSTSSGPPFRIWLKGTFQRKVSIIPPMPSPGLLCQVRGSRGGRVGSRGCCLSSDGIALPALGS